MRAFSTHFDRALALAARAHRRQVRKGSDVPYIHHPVSVAFILQRHGFPEDLVLAGLLHDVVEDCDVAIADLEAAFGAEVARLVAAVSEAKREPGASAERPWRVRKQEALHHLESADAAVAALKAADALHNCQSTLQDLAAHGPSAWTRFKAGPDEQRWYYGGIATLARERLGDHPLALELAEAVSRL